MKFEDLTPAFLLFGELRDFSCLVSQTTMRSDARTKAESYLDESAFVQKLGSNCP